MIIIEKPIKKQDLNPFVCKLILFHFKIYHLGSYLMNPACMRVRVCMVVFVVFVMCIDSFVSERSRMRMLGCVFLWGVCYRRNRRGCCWVEGMRWGNRLFNSTHKHTHDSKEN